MPINITMKERLKLETVSDAVTKIREQLAMISFTMADAKVDETVARINSSLDSIEARNTTGEDSHCSKS